MKREEMSQVLDEFVQGKGGQWDWDDFCYAKIQDKELRLIQLLCIDLPEIFPPQHQQEYCNQAGRDLLNWLARHLQRSQ